MYHCLAGLWHKRGPTSHYEDINPQKSSGLQQNNEKEKVDDFMTITIQGELHDLCAQSPCMDVTRVGSLPGSLW